MKIAAFLLLTIGMAEAFTAPSMTFAVGKKAAPAATKKVAPKAAAKPAATKVVVKKAAPAKPAPVVAKKAPVKPAPVVKKAPPKPVVVKKVAAPVVKKVAAKKVSTYSGGVVASAAIPGEVAPDILNGSLPGDVGFDPCFLSTRANEVSGYFNGIFSTNIDGLSWYRESELLHGRICMVAVVGFIWPGFSHFDGNSWTGVDAYSYTNPLEAYTKAPGGALLQIVLFMSFMEFRRINNIIKEGDNYMPGDMQKWGQGEGRWNPFGLNYTPAEYAEKQLQEVKHCRLAMIAFLALVFQANASGEGVVDQLAGAFTTPDYYAKAGYFLPQGI